MRVVLDIYGKLNGWQLSDLTHRKGTPWHETWHDKGGEKFSEVAISNETIKIHFKNKIVNSHKDL